MLTRFVGYHDQWGTSTLQRACLIGNTIDQWIWGCLGTPFSDKPHVWGLGYAEQSMDTTHISKSATNDDLTILEGKNQNL